MKIFSYKSAVNISGGRGGYQFIQLFTWVQKYGIGNGLAVKYHYNNTNIFDGDKRWFRILFKLDKLPF